MAIEFPPNLEDGELWLPLEIIPDVGSLRPTSSGAAATDLEAPAMEHAAFGFFDPYSNPNKPPPAAIRPLPYLAEGFRPANRFGFGYEEYPAPAGPGSYAQFGTANPVQPQMADGFGHGETRAPLRRENVGPASAQIFPTWVNASGQSCRGTGVFLPRVVNGEVKRNPRDGRRFGEEQREQMKDAQMQVMKPLIQVQSPAELTLPHEWTY